MGAVTVGEGYGGGGRLCSVVGGGERSFFGT